MRLKEINKPIKEYRNVVIPRDEKHYRELMKHLQDIEWDPETRRDSKLMAEIRRRRLELRTWAEKNIKREVAPPGREKQVKALKGKVDNPYAVAWASYNKNKKNEDYIGNKTSYEDFLQNKLDSAIKEYDTPEKKAERDALMQKYLGKGGTIEKVPTGQKAFVGKKLKPAFKKDKEGTPATSPMSDESAIKEGVPFGSGMNLLQRAVFNKWISADEWFHLKDEWHNAADEIEQRYSDWPDGQGFGSSDHNFAIKELMGLAGYEFDEQDRSGSFIVTKMPEKLEKKGIKNVRMRKEPVATEDAELNERMPASIIKHKQKLAKMTDKELADRFKDKDEKTLRQMAWRHGHGHMSSHYWDRAQKGKTNETKLKEDTDEYNPARLLGAAQASLMHGLEMAEYIGKKDYEGAEQVATVVRQNWPSLIDKIQNAYKNEDQEGDGIQPVDLKRLGQSEPKIYVHKDGKTIMIPKSKHNEYLAKGWKQSALKTETSYESKLAGMLNQQLK